MNFVFRTLLGTITVTVCNFHSNMLMESWSYGSEGKGLMFSEELDLSVDEFARSRKALIEWDRESVDNTDFVDWNFSEMHRKALTGNNMTVGMLDAGDVGINSSKVVVTSPTCMFASNSSLESGSNHSNSLTECNSQDCSLIDLKLGRLSDGKDAHKSYFLKERSLLSSVSEPLQVKRARTVASRFQTPSCQVHGCNKDLSSSKEYHKRHKVCEVHSKTPVVIVHGIEQRFCQQCSRFHLLSEFDDGKRSCRKRLAGHNERRRKPQFSTFSAKSLESPNSYQGTKFFGIDLSHRSTSLHPTLLPGGVLCPDSYAQVSLRHLLSAKEDQTITSKVPTTQELPGFWHSTRALSLLSAESQGSSHSARNILTKPLVNYGYAHHNSAISDQSLGAGSKERCITNGFYLSGMNSNGIDHMGSFAVSDTGHAADLQVKVDGLLQHSEFSSAKLCDSPEHGSTMDLLQLSSHLQRVDQQRKTMQVKQEHEDLCSFLTTYGFGRN